MIASEINKINQTICVDARHACSVRFCPRYCPTITAPPVASAANTLINNTIMLSTKETPETAASPTFAIMIESAMPTNTARSCSTTSGRINARNALLSNK